jgi:hypothetical protein
VSQRSVLLAVVLVLLLAAGVLATLAVLVRQEPEWYVVAAVPPGNERLAQSKAGKAELIKLYTNITKEREWDEQITDVQLNSYFEEDFIREGYDKLVLPDDIGRPRFVFEEDRIRLGFRYGRGVWSSVVSIDLRVWLPACEPNVVALELEGFHAGKLPISAQSLLEKVAEVGRKNGIDVNWYRNNGHPVALLRFQPDQPRPTFQLQAVQLSNHTLMIQGRSLDQNPAPKASDPAP